MISKPRRSAFHINKYAKKWPLQLQRLLLSHGLSAVIGILPIDFEHHFAFLTNLLQIFRQIGFRFLQGENNYIFEDTTSSGADTGFI